MLRLINPSGASVLANELAQGYSGATNNNTMSATFYPAKQDAPKSFTYVGEEHVSLANSNARYILTELGYDPDFEEHDTTGNDLDTLIHKIEHQMSYLNAVIRPRRSERYAATVMSLILATMKEGKEQGATHWYAA